MDKGILLSINWRTKDVISNEYEVCKQFKKELLHQLECVRMTGPRGMWVYQPSPNDVYSLALVCTHTGFDQQIASHLVNKALRALMPNLEVWDERGRRVIDAGLV
jgi:hypothetical protein